MSSTNSPEAVKKLLENMQGDLRALSLECKKKFPPVKEVSLGGAVLSDPVQFSLGLARSGSTNASDGFPGRGLRRSDFLRSCARERGMKFAV